MDPVSTLEATAAVVQFLDLSDKVLKTCKEISDDANAARQSNKELEQSTRMLEDFRAALGSVIRNEQADRRVATIAHECAKTGTELLELLTYIRGGTGKRGTARAIWLAILKQKPIDRLQKSLQECNAVLGKVLNQYTNTNVHVVREDFRKLGLGNRASVVPEALRGSSNRYLQWQEKQLAEEVSVSGHPDAVDSQNQRTASPDDDDEVLRGLLVDSTRQDVFPRTMSLRNETSTSAPTAWSRTRQKGDNDSKASSASGEWVNQYTDWLKRPQPVTEEYSPVTYSPPPHQHISATPSGQDTHDTNLFPPLSTFDEISSLQHVFTSQERHALVRKCSPTDNTLDEDVSRKPVRQGISSLGSETSLLGGLENHSTLAETLPFDLIGPDLVDRKPATTTDEGYYSNNKTEPSSMEIEKDQACYTGSICTDNQDIGEAISPKARQELSRRFASELIESLVIEDLTDDVLKLLPDILQDFSQMLSDKARFGVEKKASTFVRHHRENIARYAREQLTTDPGRDDSDVAKYDVSSWAAGIFGAANETADVPDDIADLPEEDVSLAEHDVEQAREFLFRSTHFSWLLGRITIASRTMSTGPQFDTFRNCLLSYLPHLLQPFEVEVDWIPFEFLSQQYAKGSGVTIGTIITYCGTGDLIEAVGCKDYIYRMWPTHGPMTLSRVEEAVGTKADRASDVETDSRMNTTTVKVYIQDRKLRACIEGDSVATLEILEVLGWLGAACRTAQNPEQAMYCSPSISKVTGLDCTISFNITALSGDQVPVSLFPSGQEIPDLVTHASINHTYCWSQLVRNPVIIKGYPVSRRHNDEKGLEIELGLMSQLATAARVMVFDGLLMLKSFNSMFVAVAEASGSLLWHYILSPHGRPVPYSEARKFCQGKVPVPVGALQHGRHFVGLTQPPTILTGTADANYDIDPTGDDFVRGGVAIKDFTLGVSRTFTMSAKVVPGRQDTRVSLSKSECFQVDIQKAKSTPVVFYDVEEKRAWMVDGQDAVLHLSRAHLSSRFAEPAESGTSAELIQQFRHRGVVNGRWQTSSEVLCDPKNLRISVGHTYQSVTSSGDQGSSSHSTSPGMCFQDVVANNVQVLRDIVAYQEYIRELKKDQIRVGNPFGAKNQIVGFGFTDIVSLETRLRPRFAKLKFSGPGWKKYADKADSIYILGSGFGDLLPSTSDCTKCTGVPPGYEFLVVSARMLQRLEDIRGISWGLPDVPVSAHENQRSISCHCAASVHGVRCGIAVTELGARSTPAERSGDKQRNKVARLQSEEYLIIGRKNDMSNARRAMQLNGFASSACDGCDVQELVRGQGLGGVGSSTLSDTSDFTPARSTSNQDSGYDTGMVDQTTDDSSPSQSSGTSDQRNHSLETAVAETPPSHDALSIPAESLRRRPTARDDQRTLPMFGSLAIDGSTTTGNVVDTPRLVAPRRRTRKMYPPAPGASTALEHRGC
ncbi:hypothetical protein LTR10_003779 [Elasticomyces elasticus]|nr:hypothetical protein LTR10_003779 [Elasticomyces elasticus]KAK4978033.1 hypothetical protein LTR42_002408 [Elasticomyces elasticus]